MKALPALFLILACGGIPVDLPTDALIDFTITRTEFSPAIECTGRIDMAKATTRFTCVDSRSSPATSASVEATMEYIRRPDEAWLHFMAIGAERDHYPTYNGIVLALSLRPNVEQTGWTGTALYYPRDSAFGYEGFGVTAFLGR